MNYEVGKYYITRFGDKAMCVRYITMTVWFVVFPMNPHAEPILIFTHLDGRKYSSGRESHDDIIGPWINKPVVDWTKMPAWFDGVVMQPDGGAWHGYFGKKPVALDGVDAWIGQPSPFWFDIPKEYHPTWTGDWRDSLVERPKV